MIKFYDHLTILIDRTYCCLQVFIFFKLIYVNLRILLYEEVFRVKSLLSNFTFYTNIVFVSFRIVSWTKYLIWIVTIHLDIIVILNILLAIFRFHKAIFYLHIIVFLIKKTFKTLSYLLWLYSPIKLINLIWLKFWNQSFWNIWHLFYH